MKISCEITLKDLEVNYEAFRALNCDQATFQGTTIALIGHNGAGKSTLIKSVLGLLVPKRGEITVSCIENEKKYQLTAAEHMAFCPESGSVFADISVETYVKLWCRIKHNDGNYYKKLGSEIVDQLELVPLFHKLGRQLSKGQRRRVQTAIGFLCEPKLFLFDEPFDGLDVARTHELADFIRARTDRMCFMVSSHRMDVMERLADYIIVLREGQVLAHGAVDDVCGSLCGSTYLISLGGNQGEQLVRDHFPDGLIYSIGSKVTLTGKGIGDTEIRERLIQNGVEILAIEEIRPSLVDAMNYHLTNL